MAESLTVAGGKVEQIEQDYRRVLDWDNEGGALERLGAVRFRLACKDGISYVASGYQDEYKWNDTVEFHLELSDFISEGGVNVYVKKADIESGAVRVDVYI